LLLLGTVTATKLIGVLTFGAWIARSLSQRRLRIIVPPQGWSAILFAAWGLLSALWAIDTQKLFAAMQILTLSIGLYILTVNLLDSLRRVQIVIAIIVLASLALSSLAIFHVVTGEFAGGRVDVVQVFGTGPHALAGYLIPGAAVLMVMFSRAARVTRKLFFLFGLSATVLAILATGTRAAVVALVVVAIAGAVIDRKVWQAVLPGVVVGGWGVSLFLPSTLLERLESIYTLSDRGAGRLDIWLVALNIIRSHPILGTGLDNFGRMFDRYLADTLGLRTYNVGRGMGSHNTFLNVQAELGMIGSVLFVAIVGLSVTRGLTAVLNLKRAGDYRATTLALGTWLGLLGMLAVCLFLDWQYTKYLWLLLALAEVTQRLSTRADREKGVEQ